MPQFAWRSDPVLGDGVADADANGDAALGIHGLEAVFVRQIVPDEDRSAAADRAAHAGSIR